jgi:hypothetical protein
MLTLSFLAPRCCNPVKQSCPIKGFMHKGIWLVCVGLLLFGVVETLRAQAVTIVILNEDGTGLVDNGDRQGTLTGLQMPDPGPGGLANALTFDLSTTIAGDLIILNSSLNTDDIIRFNPNEGTGAVVFYSTTADGGMLLADTGFPSAIYSNTFALMENPSGPTSYTPTSSEPGFISGTQATYLINSSPVPEPSVWILFLGGFTMMGFLGVVSKRRSLSAR